MILVFTSLILSIRIYYLKEKGEKFIFYKEMEILLFNIYTMILFYIVTFQDVSWSTSNFIPFKEMFRYEIGSILFFKNVIGNMLMFIPYGYFISKFLNIKNIKKILFLSFIASTSIEITQILIGRVFDVDDIILNILGGLIGYFLYETLKKINDNLPNTLKREKFYNIIVLILLMIFIWGVL